MHRLAAFALAVTVLVVAVAVRGTQGPAMPAGGFAARCWGTVDPVATPHLSRMVMVTPQTDLDEAARALGRLPAGRRDALLFGIADDLADHPLDRCKSVVGARDGQRGPWLEHGTKAVQARVAALVEGLATRGAVVDAFVLDVETTLHAAQFMAVPGAFPSIAHDPRWPALASQMGLPLAIGDPAVMDWGSPAYYRWTERMAGRFDSAMNQAVRDPLLATHAGAVIGNYDDCRTLARFATPDSVGRSYAFDTPGFGTHDTDDFYGQATPAGIAAWSAGPAPLAGDAWVVLRACVHRIRGMVASSPDRPKLAWIATRSYGDRWTAEPPGVTVPMASGPYWDEMVLQLAMAGVEGFLVWNPDAWLPDQDPTQLNPAEDRAALDALLAELDAQVGGPASPALAPAQPSWADRVLAGARRVGDSMVWRLSFDRGISAALLRFVDGRVVRVVPEPGRAGCWFSHPVDRPLAMDPGGALPVMRLLQSAGP